MSHLIGEWLVDAVISDIRKVLDGRIPFGKVNVSNDYVQDISSGFRIVSRSHVPKLVQISKLHYQGKVTAGTISDSHVAVHARFSDDSIRKYNEEGPSPQGRRPIMGHLLITNFELNVSRHGDSDQRISLVIRGFSAKGGRTKASDVGAPLTRHPLVKEVVTRLLEEETLQDLKSAKTTTSLLQSTIDAETNDSDDEPRSQVAYAAEEFYAQDKFATQARRGPAGPETQAKVHKAGGINVSGPKEALRIEKAKAKGTAQEKLLDLLKNHVQTSDQAVAEESGRTPKQTQFHGPPPSGLHDLEKPASRPPRTVCDSASLHNGTFLFAKTVPTNLLQVPHNQAKLLNQEGSWRYGEHGDTAPDLNIPEGTPTVVISQPKVPQPIIQATHKAVLLESPQHSQHFEDSEDAQSLSESEKLPWSDDSDYEMSAAPADRKDQLPPDSSLERDVSLSPVVVVSADVGLKQPLDLPPTTSTGNGTMCSSLPTKTSQHVTTSPTIRLPSSQPNESLSSQDTGMKPHEAAAGSEQHSSPSYVSEDMKVSLSSADASYKSSVSSRAVALPTLCSGTRVHSPKDESHISLDSTEPTARSCGSRAINPTQSSRPVVSLDGGFDESIARSPKAVEKASSDQTSQALRQPDLSHQTQTTPERPSQSEEGRYLDCRHKIFRPPSSQGEVQPPTKRRRLTEEPLTTHSPVDPAQVLKQQRRDFVSTRKSAHQQVYQAAQPIRSLPRDRASDADCIQVTSKTAVESPKKEPVVVIDSPTKSPSRKSMQKPGTKPQNIVPRCLPCRSTHKPCEATETDLDGPCQRCARINVPCKLVDGTIKIRKPMTARAEEVAPPQSRIPQAKVSSSAATFQHSAHMRSYSGRRTSQTSPDSRPQGHGATELQLEPSEHIKAGDRDMIQPSSTARTSRHLALYDTFRRTYPDYLGDQKHFIGRCRAIQTLHAQGKLHKSLWDDHVIRHKTEYGPYAARCNDAGDDASSYEQFYNEACDAPKYTVMLLKPDTLIAVLAATEVADVREPALAMTSLANARQSQRRDGANAKSAPEHFDLHSEAWHSPAWRDAPYRARDLEWYDDAARYREPQLYHDYHREDTLHDSWRPASRRSDGAYLGRDNHDMYYRPGWRSPPSGPYDRSDLSVHADDRAYYRRHSSVYESPSWSAAHRPATGPRTSARITPIRHNSERADDPLRVEPRTSSPSHSMSSAAKKTASQLASHVGKPTPSEGRQEKTLPSPDTRDDRKQGLASLPSSSTHNQPLKSLASQREPSSAYSRTPTKPTNAVRENSRAMAPNDKTSIGLPTGPRAIRNTAATVLANNGIQRKPLPGKGSTSRSQHPDLQGSSITSTILDDNRHDGAHPESDAPDIDSIPGPTVEWWRSDNTVFKEFARSFIGLKAFGEDLARYAEGRIDVLDWQL